MFFLKEVKFKNVLDIPRLEISKGGVTAIIGESGSGKTTLLKLLNKMISPCEGEINYEGQSLDNLNSIDLRREVVMLPQNPIIYEGSIEENLNIGLKFSGKPLANETKLKEILKFVNIDKDLKEDTSNLSGGEKQRIALARVLLMEPKVFLLDEPSSALDENTESIIIKKLKEYCTINNTSLILVTHSKNLAENYSDKIITIKSGKLWEGVK